MAEELTGVVAELRALVTSQSEQLERLQQRVIELECGGGEHSEVTGSPTRIEDDRVSRRSLLSKAGAVAAASVAGAAVASGVLAVPAAAVNGDALKAGYATYASQRTSLKLYNYENDAGFAAFDDGGFRPNPGYIAAYSRNRASGKNMPAFRGDSESSYAFYGTSTNVPAVFGSSTGSAGVQGNCTGSGPAGVIGASTSTDGVWGLSTNGIGVHGQGVTGVFGVSTDDTGVNGRSTNGVGVHGKSGASFGVFGESFSSVGVQGQSDNAAGVQAISTSVAALEAHGGTYGAWLQGDRAALYLVPQPTGGKPASGSHRRGELLCDKNGQLWFCTASGSPGTWKKVSLV